MKTVGSPVPVPEDRVDEATLDHAEREHFEKDILRLQKKVNALQEEVDSYRHTVSIFKRLTAYVSIGPGLARSLEEWLAASKAARKDVSVFKRWMWWKFIPEDQTIAVVSAYIRRNTVAAVLIALLAAIPGSISMIILWFQNKKIDQQIHLTAATQAGYWQGELAQVISSVNNAPSNMCLDETQYAAFLASLQKDDRESLKGVNYRCWKNVPRTYSEDWTKIWGPDQNGRAIALPENLQYKIAILTTIVRPYRVLLENSNYREPELSRELRSPERGLLLRSVAEAKVLIRNIDLAYSWAPDGQFPGVSLHTVNLSGSRLDCANFSESDLNSSSMNEAFAAGADFKYSKLSTLKAIRADFSFANFEGASLPPSANLAGSVFDGANFHGAMVPEEGWLRKVGMPAVVVNQYSEYSQSGEWVLGRLSTEMARVDSDYCAKPTRTAGQPIAAVEADELREKALPLKKIKGKDFPIPLSSPSSSTLGR